jgi:aspartyl-tRNA(Asn)/glutamyl-tRNA(Gln) amidotransferase subunit A
MDEPIWALDACDIADRVRAGDIAAKEVLEVFLERIEAHNAELNALVHVDAAGARAQAAEVDHRIGAGEDPGPLAGVPVGVKDLENVRGLPTTHGSVPYAGHVAAEDSIQVSRLRRAGAVIVGKTAAPEFGTTSYTSTPLHGTTRNPWNPARTPGGSSGGSAAAVSAGLLPLATASDGGGSTRIPAAYTGLFGPKGTFGRVPRGDGPDSSMTTCYSPITRTVKDAARHLDCVVGAHESDQFSLPHPGLRYEEAIATTPRGLRAAWSADLGFGMCAPEVAEIARRAADALGVAAGLRWIDTPVELRDPSVAWSLLNAPGIWLAVQEHWETAAEDFTPITQASVNAGEHRFTMKEVARALERRWINNRILAGVFEVVDVIITPTTSTTAYAAEGPIPTEIDGRPIKPIHHITFTYPFNMSGHPAVSVPCGVDADGLPVGLQITGRRHEDHVTLQLAAAFEHSQPWPKFAPKFAPAYAP